MNAEMEVLLCHALAVVGRLREITYSASPLSQPGASAHKPRGPSRLYPVRCYATTNINMERLSHSW